MNDLRCSRCDWHSPIDALYNLCPQCSAPILVHYDFATPPRLRERNDMWRYADMLPIDDDREIVTLGEGIDSAPALARARECPHQGRVEESDALVQVARHGGGGDDGEEAGRQEPRRADGGERRRRALRVWRTRGACRYSWPCLATRRSRSSTSAVATAHRLSSWPASSPTPAKRVQQFIARERRLRSLDAQGAVSRRREEDHGLRAARRPRRPSSRRDPLPDRRRHGSHRHVEGVRRDGAPRLDR